MVGMSNSNPNLRPIPRRLLFVVNKHEYSQCNDDETMENLLIDSIGLTKKEIESVSKFKICESMVYKHDLKMINQLGLKTVHHYSVLLNTETIYSGSQRYTAIMRNITIGDLNYLFTDVYINDKRMIEYRDVIVCFFHIIYILVQNVNY